MKKVLELIGKFSELNLNDQTEQEWENLELVEALSKVKTDDEAKNFYNKYLGTITETLTVEVTNIDWYNAPSDLSTEMTIIITEYEANLNDTEEVIELVSDKISNESGFCHNGFATDLD